MIYRICALLFLWCAYVQINDPDPVVWISIYLVAACTLEMAARYCVSSNEHPLRKYLYYRCYFIVSKVAWWVWGDMAVDHNIELARETGGFNSDSILSIWIFYKQRHNSSKTS